MPASFGVQGPGEMTIASGSIATTSSTVILSLRRTASFAPSSPRIMDEVVGEAVVVIDDEDGHGPTLTAPCRRRGEPYRLFGRAEKGARLATHSSCSFSGTESATMPAPACTYILPSLMIEVRRMMQESMSPLAVK